MKENPDQIDSRLRQNDFDRDVTEWRNSSGGCGVGCLSSLFNLVIWGFILIMAICMVIAQFVYD